jgi:hypothetical protein
MIKMDNAIKKMELGEAEEKEPKEDKGSKERIEKPKDMEDRESDHPHSQFDILFDRIVQKIDRRPSIRRPHLYKALLQSLIIPLSAAGSNKAKLAVAAKQFLADFNEIQKG